MTRAQNSNDTLPISKPHREKCLEGYGQAGEKYRIDTYQYFRPKMVIILLFFLYIILYKF
jgi:hypothetical protein